MEIQTLKECDVVYIVKDSSDNEELRYSIRSLVNFPHRKVWIFGGKPSWVKNVEFIPTPQSGSKWQNTARALEKIKQIDGLSDNFFLFNDDFYVLNKITNYGYFFNETLNKRAEATKSRFGYSVYGQQLRNALEWLKMGNYDTLNYELHIPFLYNKEKLKNLTFPDNCWGARRSIYGNVYKVGGKQKYDVKIANSQGLPLPSWDFTSSSDISFKSGRIGRYIRNKFKEKSSYED